MKNKFLLLLFFGLFTFSACQEEIAPKTTPTGNNGGNSGGNSGGSNNGGNDTSHTISDKFADCLEILDTNTLDVVTWNIENFPVAGSTTVTLVADIIENMYPDIIAVQEIKDASDFNSLLSKIADKGYEGRLENVRGSQDIGYIYKTSEITAISNVTQLYPSDSYAFPRQPVLAKFTHKSGFEVTLINVHLKALNEGKARRIDASKKLKSYIDENLSDKPVIILGDFNDEIDEKFSGGDAFANFINDPSNYKFADQEIEEGSSANWSYPSYPSHLDHILITNELFSKLSSTQTIKLSSCASNYSYQASDHRPVMARFTTD